MSQREPLFSRGWRETESERGSPALWVAGVLSGAALAVAGYFVAPADYEVVLAFFGVVCGFFAPYAAQVIWGAVSPVGESQDEEWAKVGPVIRRTR